MKKADWIWINKLNNKDEYVNFLSDFEIDIMSEINLKISCDTDYTIYINGELAAFGQYPDYPYYKVYDNIDISKYVQKGRNRLAINAYYAGEDFMTYYKSNAGMMYEITQNGNVIVFSNEKTKCRNAADYMSGRQIKITGQLGFGYFYDMSEFDGWNKENFDYSAFLDSTLIEGMPEDLYIRSIKKLELKNRAKSSLIKAGSFKYNGGNTTAEKQQLAEISYNAIKDNNKITVNKGGVYALFDIGREEVGFLNFKIKTDKKTNISIGWGEHITNGRVHTYIDGRNFAIDYISCEGEQEYLNTFKRFGARYLQIFAETESIEIEFLTLCPIVYPLNIQKFNIENKLRQQIYDVSVRTLQLCMHDHYEDCPWREQGLYTMDSRNQMLCGYYAFGEKEFARASLKLIGLDKSEDGLLSICYPSNINLKIPSFSLYYIIQMKEYIEHTGDLSLAFEFYDKLQLIIKVFMDRLENNLISNFYSEVKYWNFYEWSEGLCGNLGYPDKKGFDLILNCLLSIALQKMIYISKALNKINDIDIYERTYKELNRAITSEFYDTATGFYRNSLNSQYYSELGNALAILCGAADENIQAKIADKLIRCNSQLIDITLSMSCFKYDALLKVNKERYAEYVLTDIDNKYGFMLQKGATSFWETIKGENDFGGAGSLCHGWSAMPVYYYHILNKNK